MTLTPELSNTSAIPAGTHVHTHNTGLGDLSARGRRRGSAPTGVPIPAPADLETFDGYRRPAGRSSPTPPKRSKSSADDAH
jgi:hypothetical protein